MLVSEKLDWPELVWREGGSKPAIEIGIDFLPEPYHYTWDTAILEITAKLCRRNKWPEKATIWQWGSPSVNLVRAHPEHREATWSEFLVQFGFPKAFWDELGLELHGLFNKQCGMTGEVSPRRSEGWQAMCHVEQGKVWFRADAATWLPFVPKKV
jgi:hypothetical protein